MTKKNSNRNLNNNKQLKIMHIIGKLIPAGVETRTLELIKATSSKDVMHFVCVTSGEVGTLDHRYIEAGATLEYINIKNLRFPFLFFQTLRQHSINVVHSNLMYVDGFVLTIARVAGVQNRIAQFQSDGVRFRRHQLLKRGKRSILKYLIKKNANNIVGLTPANLEVAWSDQWKKDPRCMVVTNGVSVPQLERCRASVFSELKDATIIVHVGRGGLPTKNRPKAISAFASYHQGSNSNSYLFFIGRDGADSREAASNRLEWVNCASKHGVAERVKFLGERQDVMSLLLSADIFLFTSLLEGLPGVVLEALAAGLPVVSSDLPGVKYVAEEFSEVRMLNPNQSDEEWGRALDACPRKLSETERLLAIEKFSESSFEMSKAVQRYLNLWRGNSIGI